MRTALRRARSAEVAKAASLTTVALVAGRILGFAAALIGASILDPQEFGQFGYATATAAMVSAAGTLGIPPLLTREVAARSESLALARHVGTRVTVLAAGSLAVCGAAYIVTVMSPLRPLLSTDEQALSLTIGIALWAILSGLNAVLNALLAAHKEFGLAALVAVSRSCAVAVGSIFAALMFQSSAAVILGTAVGEAIGFAFALAAVLSRRLIANSSTPQVTGGRRPQDDRVTENFSMSSFIAAATAAGAAALAIQAGMWFGQRLLIAAPQGLEQLGIFTVASRLVLVITIVPAALASVALPYLAEGKVDGAGRQSNQAGARNLLLLSLLLAAAVAIVMAAMVPPLLSRMDPGYEDGSGVVVLMCLVGISMVVNTSLGTSAVAAGRIQAWVTSDWVLALALIAMTLWLVPGQEAGGLAIAHLCAYSCSAAVLLLPWRARFRSTGSIK